jgi:hypothetical protein
VCGRRKRLANPVAGRKHRVQAIPGRFVGYNWLDAQIQAKEIGPAMGITQPNHVRLATRECGQMREIIAV